jgi:hypothetical protein
MARKTTTRLLDDVLWNTFCIIGKEKQSAFKSIQLFAEGEVIIGE